MEYFLSLLPFKLFTYLPHTDCICLYGVIFQALYHILLFFSPYGTSFNDLRMTILESVPYTKKFLYGTDLKHFKNYNLAICTILIKFPTYGTNRKQLSEPKSNILYHTSKKFIMVQIKEYLFIYKPNICTICSKMFLYGTNSIFRQFSIEEIIYFTTSKLIFLPIYARI